jgi:AcrR family transcriptional regulator
MDDDTGSLATFLSRRREHQPASTEAAARLAGVGIATVFRHFPAKSGLLDEVLARRFERLRERAGRLAARSDPGPALFGMFTEMVSDAPSKIAIAEALVEPGGGTDPGSRAARASGELQQAVGVLLQQSGSCNSPSRAWSSRSRAACPRW